MKMCISGCEDKIQWGLKWNGFAPMKDAQQDIAQVSA